MMTRMAQRLGLTRYEADEYYKRALDYYRKKQMAEAIIEIGYAIELLPNNAEYLAARGFFYLEDGAEKEAEADFQQALSLYQYELLALYGRGVMAYNNKNYKGAVAHLTDAYRVDPKRPETLYYLALAHHRLGENERALALMEQAVSGYEARDETRSKRNAERWAKEFKRLVQQAAG